MTAGQPLTGKRQEDNGIDDVEDEDERRAPPAEEQQALDYYNQALPLSRDVGDDTAEWLAAALLS